MEKHLNKVLFFLIWFLIHIPNNSADCGDNEYYESDTSLPTCENTCSNRNLVCIQSPAGWEGCRCISGYYRNSFGRCVDWYDCDVSDGTCGEYEYNSGNDNDSRDCEATCRVPHGTCDGERKYGCYCDDGYLRNANGICTDSGYC